MSVHICHGFSLPPGVTSDLYERIDKELTYMSYSIFSYPSIQLYARVGIGFLVKEIWQVREQGDTRLSFNPQEIGCYRLSGILII